MQTSAQGDRDLVTGGFSDCETHFFLLGRATGIFQKEIEEAQERFAEIEEAARRKDLKAQSVEIADEAARHIMTVEIAG